MTDTVRLGDTDLEVSRVCVGTWELSGAWGRDTDLSRAAIRRAWDSGVTFFDTAHAYGWGAAEEALGEVLGDVIRTRRSDVVLLTKGGVEGSGSSYVRNSDADHLSRTLEDSLRRLGTDHVDIFLVHWPDPCVPLADTAGVVQGLVDRGLARHGGVSNFSVDQVDEYRTGGWAAVASVPYSLLRQAAAGDVIPRCHELGVGVLGHAPLAHGLLTGAIGPDHTFAPDDWRSEAREFTGEALRRRVEAVGAMSEIAAAHGLSIAQAALAWVLADPAGIVPVLGAERPDHVGSSLAAVTARLDAAAFDELARIGRSVPSLGSSGIPSRASTSAVEA